MDNAENQNDFCSDPDVKRKVNKMLEMAETGENNIDDHHTVLAYLAAKIMYKNSQRPGVVEIMTIKEFDARKEH